MTTMHPCAAGARARFGLIAVAVVVAWLPPALQAQPSMAIMRSTVRITCTLPDGKVMNASGFVWPDEMHVVTALHAVAGCRSRSVFSEATRGSALADVASVLLEGDLALLKLGKSLGVGPARASTTSPNLGSRFDIVGYPLGVDMAKSDPVTFSTGMQGAVVTLESAYGNLPEMQEMFSSPEQPYPSRNASILRVGSTLQPGHSGAPIFDSQGLVVAVADGGLYKGFAGMNWSVPADVYLPRLRTSKDPHPTRPSLWAIRFSAVAVPPSTPVAVPANATTSKGGELAAGAFRRVRRLPIDMVDELLRKQNEGKPDSSIETIRSHVSQEAFASLAFDIYEDPMTGATVGVPSQTDLTWNGDIRALEAQSPDRGVRMILGVLSSSSHEQAKESGKKALLRPFLHLARWQTSPETLPYMNVTPADGDYLGWANGANFFNGIDQQSKQPVSLLLSMSVLGRHFMGFGVYGPQDIGKNLSEADFVTYMMMQIAGNSLADFARR
jgi:hypothetical protein